MTKRRLAEISTFVGRTLMATIFLALMTFGIIVNPGFNWLTGTLISALCAFLIPVPIMLLVDRILLVRRKRGQLKSMSAKWRLTFLAHQRADLDASIRYLGGLVGLLVGGLLFIGLLILGASSLVSGLASLSTGTLLAIIIVLLVLRQR